MKTRPSSCHRSLRAAVGSVGVFLLLACPAAGLAQVSVAPRVGTLGLGADVGLGIFNVLTARTGFGFWPIDVAIDDLDGEDYDGSVPSGLTAGLDLHPGGGGFHISGGLFFQFGELRLTGTPSSSREIGDHLYTPEEIGTLRGELVNKDVAPFLLLGFGKHGSDGIGLFLDLGVAFMGEPEIELTGDGDLRGDPQFEDDLRLEAQNIEDEDALRTWGQFWPIVNVGLRIGFGGSRDDGREGLSPDR